MIKDDDINPDWDGTIREIRETGVVDLDLVMYKHDYDLMLKGEGPFGKYRDQILRKRS